MPTPIRIPEIHRANAAGQSRHSLFKRIETLCLNDQVKMILRTSPSGSFTRRQSLSQIIVRLVSGSVGCQVKPGTLGFPVAAKAAQDDAIFFANA